MKTLKKNTSEEKSFSQTDLLKFHFDSFKKLFYDKEKEKKISLFWKMLKSFFPVVGKKNKNFSLDVEDYYFEKPSLQYLYCLEKGLSYAGKLSILFVLKKETEKGKIEETRSKIFMGEVPYLTEYGTFVYNGIERVGVSQLKKTIGPSFLSGEDKDNITEYLCRIIPQEGSWIEFTTNAKGVVSVCFDKKNKFLLTTFLRCLGYGKNIEIIKIFCQPKEIKNISAELAKHVGDVVVDDVVGEDNIILIKKGSTLSEQNVLDVSGKKVSPFFVLKKKEFEKVSFLFNTLSKDNTKTIREAQEEFFKSFNPQKKITKEDDLDLFINNRLFNIKNYDLGETGRGKLNLLLNLKEKETALTKNDIVQLAKAYFSFLNKEKVYGEADSFCNKKIATITEQLYDQFRIIFARICHQISAKMNIVADEKISIFELVNNSFFFSVINSFFATNPSLQFMDEMNPLAEMMHKRKVSVIGVNGISRESRITSVRDVNYSQYGKICPLETPEGENIGLISSIAKNAELDSSGTLLTPYRRVVNGVVQFQEDVVYLDAGQETGKKIVRANIKIKENGEIDGDYQVVRIDKFFKTVRKEEIDYIEVDSGQAFSLAASTIPFLENDEASRAMMGINMQKQAIPVLGAQQPIVGTGIEKDICKYSRRIFYAEGDGVVEYADAKKIVIRYDKEKDKKEFPFEKKREVKEYELIRMKKGNQKLAVSFVPLVRKGQRVKKGDVLTEGFATKNGELSLGVNLKVAFMTWKGFNFEDAIIISDKLVKKDTLTSIFIEKYETTAKETKSGKEAITKNINEISIQNEENIDEEGLVKEGLFVKAGDLLVGKTVPVSSQESSSPENTVLKKIFGMKAQSSVDSSLTVPPFVQGTVIKTNLIKKEDRKKKNKTREEEEALLTNYNLQLQDLIFSVSSLLKKLVVGEKTKGIFLKTKKVFIKKKSIEESDVDKIFKEKNNCIQDTGDLCGMSFLENIVLENWLEDKKKSEEVKILLGKALERQNEIIDEYKRKIAVLKENNILPFEVLEKAEVTIAEKRKIKTGDKLSGRHGNKGVISKIVREEDMPFLSDGTRVDIILTPLGIPSRMNIGQLYETLLGLSGEKLGKKYVTPIFNGITFNEIEEELKEANIHDFCATDVYDGQTGEKFENKITVGNIYMLKLNHMVDDKVHARSVGKYSMLSQQPLKGRVNFGGQRFGEMEVWALEAYGASNILYEMMTVKSDDIQGRRKVYSAIVNGVPLNIKGETESFFVLLNELQAIGMKLSFE